MILIEAHHSQDMIAASAERQMPNLDRLKNTGTLSDGKSFKI